MKLGAIDSLTTLASFPGIYLISGWFVGNHLSGFFRFSGSKVCFCDLN